MTMKLFIVRHGDSPFGTVSDHQRPLSLKGKMQAQKTAQFIASQLTNRNALIMASDAMRTLETAKIIQQSLSATDLVSDHRFYGALVGDWSDAISQQENASQLILVGHNPTVSQLTQYLGANRNLHFTPACVAYFDLEIAPDGLKLPATLNAFYSPDAN